MQSNFKSLILIVFLTFSTTIVFCQENDFISGLKTKLLLYRTQKIDQSIVIQTDKTLYRPGEIIWMKAYVVDAITHLQSLNSLELSVHLTDNKGVNVFEGKFLLKNGVVGCNFSVPANLRSDVYYLIAYTHEMENVGIQTVFRKELFIGRPEQLGMVPNLEYSKPFFTPEQKEKATIRLKDFYGKPLSGKKYEYQIINETREVLAGKGKTGVNGDAEIVFLTPAPQNGNPLMVSLEIPSGNDRLNLISKIPLVSEKINISFFPEGGNLVPGIPQMVIFEALDQLGKPVSIKAEILDEQGKTVVVTATIQPGLGVFSLRNSAGQKLKFKIISDFGKNQETQLPSPVPGSMSINVKKNDGKNLSLLIGRSPKSELAKFMIVAVSNGEMIWASDFELEQTGMLNVPLDNFRSDITALAIFSETGFLVAQRLVYTGKSQSLNITISADKSGYKKGEEGLIKVKVTGSDGKPVKAELAVSMADRYTFPASATRVGSLNYGLDKPLPFNEPLDKVNRNMLDYFLSINSLKGFDWHRVIAIDPVKTQNLRLNASRVSGTVADSKNLHKTFKDELANSQKNVTANDWQLLEQIYASNYFKENPDYLKAIPASKVKSEVKKTRDPYWKKYLTTSSSILDILKTIRPYETLGGRIVFRGANSFNFQDGALIVIDGHKMGSDISSLTSVNPFDVEDIQVFVNPVDMSRYTSLNSVGVIEITTKRGLGGDNKSDKIVDSQKAKEPGLFKPVAIGNEKYDLKTTLQWIPVLFTDEKGEAIIPFRTGGVKSTFILEIAGFTDQGQWIGKQMEIQVD